MDENWEGHGLHIKRLPAPESETTPGSVMSSYTQREPNRTPSVDPSPDAMCWPAVASSSAAVCIAVCLAVCSTCPVDSDAKSKRDSQVTHR